MIIHKYSHDDVTDDRSVNDSRLLSMISSRCVRNSLALPDDKASTGATFDDRVLSYRCYVN